MNVGAHATATGGSSAAATAYATGVYQETDPVAINFDNSGTINVAADGRGDVLCDARRDRPRRRDRLSRIGIGRRRSDGRHHQRGWRRDQRHGQRHGSGHRGCACQGILVENAATTTVAGSPPAVVTNAEPVDGVINNSGTLNVVAHASGGVASATHTHAVYTTSGAGTHVVYTTEGPGTAVAVTTTTTTTPLSSALATGIRVDGGVNNMTISNSGSINVDAITENGGSATAYGIRVTANGAVVPAADDVTTIENSGDIIVRVSTDGGTTFHRGTAIDVTEAPNRR